MALKLLHTTGTPVGEYDAKDSELTTFLGGECVTFSSVVATADGGAADVNDGYLNLGTGLSRLVLAKTAGTGLPFMLVDDGTAKYGTSFGTITGGTAGQQVTGGAVLGPHSAQGSGKLTVWTTPGLFAVSLDAVDTTASTGLVPTNTTLAPGAKLFVMTGGLLTPNSSASGASASAWAGRFVSFETDRTLVTSQYKQVQALNSPTGAVAPTTTYTWAVFHFAPMV